MIDLASIMEPQVANPLDVLDDWITEARSKGVALPEAMTLATVRADGRPAARVVLFKGRSPDGRGLKFYTNYDSPKARELELSPFAALVFHWASEQRQVRVEGAVLKTSEQDSDQYFRTRPRESQIGAWASPQSQILAERGDLDRLYAEQVERFDGVDVPRPPGWGGFEVRAEQVELWIGRAGRLHDRFQYRLDGDTWSCVRLAP